MKQHSIFPVTLVTVLTLTFSISGPAEVYKSVDKSGKVTFSDRPKANSTEIELETTNIFPPTKIENQKKLSVLPEPDNATGYTSLSITQPANDTIIPNGLVPFNIVVNVKPELVPGHKLQLLVDGNIIASSNSTSIRVESLTRGQHKILVAIIDESGSRLKQSNTVSVFAYRP